MSIDDLTAPERLLWEAFARGALVDLRPAGAKSNDVDSVDSWGAARVIRAEVIRALLLGAGTAERGFVPGVRVSGARISGRLDLTCASIPYPLACESCHFDEEILLVDSSTRSIRIRNSRFPAFDGTRMQVNGILDLTGCRVRAMVRLDQAKVIGRMCLRGVAVGENVDAVVLPADGLSVDGDVECVALKATGAVSVRGIQVTGSLDLTDAEVYGTTHHALAIGNATIGRRLIGRNLQVNGEMLLHDTRVTRIELAGAQLHNPAGMALSAGGLTASGGVFCSGGFTAHGRVWLVGARLEANLSFAKATLTNPGETALKLDRATIGDFDGSDLTCTGQISLIAARVASDMRLARARIDGGGQQAIIADGAIIEGTLDLKEIHTTGEVTMVTGHVGRRVILTGAQLENPGRTALRLTGSGIASDMFCRNASFTGEVRLIGTEIRSHLDFDHAQLVNPAGLALNARGLRAGELSLQPQKTIQGIVDLGHAHIDVLRDDPDHWPDQLNLDGLTYLTLEPQLPAHQRLRWLTQHQHGHPLQPYEHLAAHYSGLGEPAEARRVLYARERLQRRTRRPLARTWSILQDVTVAYGYQPWRALLWLAILLTAGSILFAADPPPPIQASLAPHFNPVIYTLDLLLPVVDLGQKHAFNPAGIEQWITYLLVASGWILATTIAAGAARVLSRR